MPGPEVLPACPPPGWGHFPPSLLQAPGREKCSVSLRLNPLRSLTGACDGWALGQTCQGLPPPAFSAPGEEAGLASEEGEVPC